MEKKNLQISKKKNGVWNGEEEEEEYEVTHKIKSFHSSVKKKL